MEKERFLYEIRPIRPIKNLIPDKEIMKACSIHLTKEEVLMCLPNAVVWRKFPNRSPIKVTRENLDKLHMKRFSDIGVISNIPAVDMIYLRENIKKIEVDASTKEFYFIDNSGSKNKEFTDKYKDKIHIASNYAFMDNIRGIRIPVEYINNNSSEPDTNEDPHNPDNNFLLEKEEEFSAPTNNSFSKKSKKKVNIRKK